MNLKSFSPLVTNSILFSILLIFLRIDLVFSDSLPTGGDMGAHIVPTKFFVLSYFQILKSVDGQMIGSPDILLIISIFHYPQLLLLS